MSLSSTSRRSGCVRTPARFSPQKYSGSVRPPWPMPSTSVTHREHWRSTPLASVSAAVSQSVAPSPVPHVPPWGSLNRSAPKTFHWRQKRWASCCHARCTSMSDTFSLYHSPFGSGHTAESRRWRSSSTRRPRRAAACTTSSRIWRCERPSASGSAESISAGGVGLRTMLLYASGRRSALKPRGSFAKKSMYASTGRFHSPSTTALSPSKPNHEMPLTYTRLPFI